MTFDKWLLFTVMLRWALDGVLFGIGVRYDSHRVQFLALILALRAYADLLGPSAIEGFIKAATTALIIWIIYGLLNGRR